MPTKKQELPTTLAWDGEVLSRLLESGREHGCVDASAISRIGDELDLDDEGVHEIQQRLEDEGVSVTDDCGNHAAPPTAVTYSDMAVYTTDALQQFLPPQVGLRPAWAAAAPNV